MNDFTFAGKSAWDAFRLVIEHIPAETAGRKIINTVQIPGRTGTLTIDTGAIANATKSYDVAFAGRGRITEAMREVRQWLASSSGYQVLTDTYDPHVFRLARVTNLGDFENIMLAYARGTITFDCDPRRFLISGETPITAAGVVDNPGMPSRPRISLSATGAGTAVVGGTTITVSAAGDIVIDSETRVIEEGATKVSFTDFPTIPEGVSTISITGGVSVVSIIPRWWQP